MKADTTVSQHLPKSHDKVFVIRDGRILADFVDQSRVSLPTPGHFRSLNPRQLLLVGAIRQTRYFLLLDPFDDRLIDGLWLPLRQLLFQLDEAEFALAGRAAQIHHWQSDHQYCSRCGHPCNQHDHELAMVCTHCDYRQYPRINPCVIVLVTKDDKALLARNSRFKGGFYSCLAGFIEAGESAEQALHREVLEEVGIEIGNFDYYGSQSWPFPHSLMLGFYAEWKSGKIVPDGEEIIEVDWFDAGHLPEIPTHGSIAHSLIDGWIKGQSNKRRLIQ